VTLLQDVVYTEKYARWDWAKGRREIWEETVARAVAYLRELSQDKLLDYDYQRIHRAILEKRVMPSMRLLNTAGEPARRNNVALFNCSALPLLDLRAFSEVMLLSMNGVGVGYSVERQFVEQLPVVSPTRDEPAVTVTVEDSTEGWVAALLEFLELTWDGFTAELDYSRVRPAGSVLRVKGGRASGPEPLAEAIEAIRKIIRSRAGKKLRPIDASDIACWVASASISGGVRRSALLALFDIDDQQMRRSKAGAFWEFNPQRMYANISAVISNSTPDREVRALLEQMNGNGSGEPGIFNREGTQQFRPARRENATFLLNPLVA
jgi:ribonucleoside-triphosphate reductase